MSKAAKELGDLIDYASCHSLEERKEMDNLLLPFPEKTEKSGIIPLSTVTHLPFMKLSGADDFAPLHRFLTLHKADIDLKPKDEVFVDLVEDFHYHADYKVFDESYRADSVVQFFCRHPLCGIYLFFEKKDFDKSKDTPIGIVVLQHYTKNGYINESICFLKSYQAVDPKTIDPNTTKHCGTYALMEAMNRIQSFMNMKKRLPLFQQGKIKMMEVKGMSAGVSIRNAASLCAHAKFMRVYDYVQIIDEGKCEDGIGFSWPGISEPDGCNTRFEGKLSKDLHSDMVQKLHRIAESMKDDPNNTREKNHANRQLGLAQMQKLTMPLFEKRKLAYEKSRSTGFLSYFTLKNMAIAAGVGVTCAGIALAVRGKRKSTL